jgi:peptidoglycan/LPS O-acetylase OafA/YrhL
MKVASRSYGIDMLRGVAVLLVMLSHLPFSLGGRGLESLADALAGPQRIAVFPPPAISALLGHGH